MNVGLVSVHAMFSLWRYFNLYILIIIIVIMLVIFLSSNLGRKISVQSGNDREASFLFQRISVLIQRFIAILLHDSFAQEDD